MALRSPMFDVIASLLRRKPGAANLHPVAPAVKPSSAPGIDASAMDGGPPEPTVRRVLSVIYDPVVDRAGRRLSQAMGWYDPAALEAEYVRDVPAGSHGLLEYRVVDRIERDAFYSLVDGFT